MEKHGTLLSGHAEARPNENPNTFPVRVEPPGSKIYF